MTIWSTHSIHGRVEAELTWDALSSAAGITVAATLTSRAVHFPDMPSARGALPEPMVVCQSRKPVSRLRPSSSVWHSLAAVVLLLTFLSPHLVTAAPFNVTDSYIPACALPTRRTLGGRDRRNPLFRRLGDPF